MEQLVTDLRDIQKRPYSVDERRVVDYLWERTNGQVGGGDDPIGFLIASHRLAQDLYADEKMTVDKVWQALGISRYEDAQPHTIWEHVAMLKNGYGNTPVSRCIP
jgi:hypothetical protein